MNSTKNYALYFELPGARLYISLETELASPAPRYGVLETYIKVYGLRGPFMQENRAPEIS